MDMDMNQFEGAEILEDVTVVIRSARERTEEACKGLIEEQGVKKKTCSSFMKLHFRRL